MQPYTSGDFNAFSLFCSCFLHAGPIRFRHVPGDCQQAGPLDAVALRISADLDAIVQVTTQVVLTHCPNGSVLPHTSGHVSSCPQGGGSNSQGLDRVQGPTTSASLLLVSLQTTVARYTG